MDLWLYLKPDNQIALMVIWILSMLFAAWLLSLVLQSIRLLRYRTEIQTLSEVRVLESLWQERLARSQMASTEDEQAGLRQNAEAVFLDYQESKLIKRDSPIVRHVKAIFDAGWFESQFSLTDLIQHTSNSIFRPTGLLRSILSLFIIIGLLGTLFGLAISLSRLTPLAAGDMQQSNQLIAQGLRQLLGELKSAFAPSIWGILFTIIGVIFFSLHLHFVVASTKSLLERVTMLVWVPRLLPTTSQKLIETLRLSERQMQRSFEAAAQVAEFAESIQSDVGNLKKSIKSASGTLSQLSQSSSNINQFADRFVEGVNGLAPFQQELRTLYAQMVGESQSFQERVRQDIESSAEFQRSTTEILKSQHVQLEALLRALNLYEEAYIKRRSEIDKTLQRVLEQARKAYEQIGERNDEINSAIVTSLGDPLRKDLGEGLNRVEGTLQVQLSSLVDRFGTFDAPINQAAKKIEGTLETVVKRTEDLTGELQREFLKQNETNQIQLQQLDSLNKKILELLTGLAQNSSAQGEHAQRLGNQVTNLAHTIGALERSVSELRHGITGAGRPAPEAPSPINPEILTVLRQIANNTSPRRFNADYPSDAIGRSPITRGPDMRRPEPSGAVPIDVKPAAPPEPRTDFPLEEPATTVPGRSDRFGSSSDDQVRQNVKVREQRPPPDKPEPETTGGSPASQEAHPYGETILSYGASTNDRKSWWQYVASGLSRLFGRGRKS